MSKYHPLQEVIEGEEALKVMTATIAKFDVGHLALYDGRFPYVVPVNHTYDEGKLLIHCGLSGKKLDILREHPEATYGIYAPADGVIGLDRGEGGIRSCSKNYESVICYGYARLVDDLLMRRRLLGLLARDYHHAELKHAEETTCNCIVFEILEMTGRYAYHPAPKVIYHYAFGKGDIAGVYLAPESTAPTA